MDNGWSIVRDIVQAVLAVTVVTTFDRMIQRQDAVRRASLSESSHSVASGVMRASRGEGGIVVMAS